MSHRRRTRPAPSETTAIDATVSNTLNAGLSSINSWSTASGDTAQASPATTPAAAPNHRRASAHSSSAVRAPAVNWRSFAVNGPPPNRTTAARKYA